MLAYSFIGLLSAKRMELLYINISSNFFSKGKKIYFFMIYS